MNTVLEQTPPRMKGVLAAVLTPLNADLSPDIARMARHCRWLLDNGCDGLGVLGTTGEALSFSVSERISILEGLADAGIPMECALPGTGAAALSDSVELTRHATDIGAGGCLILPPFYFKEVSDDGVYASFCEVVERVASPDLQAYVYNFPQMSGVPISYDVIERLLRAYPQTVVGIKDSSGNLDNMLGMLERFPGFSVFPGSERAFLDVLKAGGAGCITAVSNISASLAQRVYSAWVENETLDEEAFSMMQAVREVITAYPLQTALKAVVARHCDDAGWSRVRPPLVELNDDICAEMFGKLDATGLRLPPLP